MERYAKALVVVLVGIVAYVLAKAGVDIPADKVEVIITEIVTVILVYAVPNRPA